MLPKWRISYDHGDAYGKSTYPTFFIVPANARARWVDGLEQRARSEVATRALQERIGDVDACDIAKRFNNLANDLFPGVSITHSPTLYERQLHIVNAIYWRLPVLEHEAAHVCRALSDAIDVRDCPGSDVAARKPHSVWDFGRRIDFYRYTGMYRALGGNHAGIVRNAVEQLIAQAPPLADTASKMLSKVLIERCGLGLHDAQCWVGEEFPAQHADRNE